MRSETDAGKVQRFMEELGQRCPGGGNVYFAGGTSAVLVGWRQSTIDIDLKFEPEPAGAFAAIVRGHSQDLKDVREMLARQLIHQADIEQFVARVLVGLERYPALDSDAVREKVDDFLRTLAQAKSER